MKISYAVHPRHEIPFDISRDRQYCACLDNDIELATRGWEFDMNGEAAKVTPSDCCSLEGPYQGNINIAVFLAKAVF